MKPFSLGVFRAYDIRGIVDRDFDEEWVEVLGQALGTAFRAKGFDRAALGRDCRVSSPGYAARLAAGLLSCGVDVVDVGMVPTPLLYYSVKKLGLSAGVMITASHNPPEYNGFKIWMGETTIHGEAVADIGRIMAAGDFAAGRGVYSELDMVPSYLDDLSRQVPALPPGQRPPKIVVDGGNGAGGLVCVDLLRRIGAEVVPLFCEPDGRFPNHHPDPVVEANMGALKAAVLSEKADAGVGLDGDADRIGAVDETGRLLYGDQLLAIFARPMLAQNPKATVIAEVKCSHLLYKDIEAHGGVAVMAATGHSFMKAKLIETHAKLAGEMSGHMFFADRYYGFDDAVYAALRLTEILMRRPGEGLSTYLADWPKTCNTPEIRMDCPDELKFAIVERAKAHFRAQGQDIIDVDGVRLVFPDGWGLVRASNTQPVLVLRFEAESEARLAAIRALIEEPLAAWIKAGSEAGH